MKVGVNVMVPVLLRHVRKTSLLLMVLEHWYFNLKANMYVRMTVSLQHDRNMGEEAIFSFIEFVVSDVEFYLLAMSVHGHLDCSLQVGMYVMMTVLLLHVRDKNVRDKNLLLKVHGHLYFNVEVCTYMVKTVLLWHVCDKSLLCVVHGHLDCLPRKCLPATEVLHHIMPKHLQVEVAGMVAADCRLLQDFPREMQAGAACQTESFCERGNFHFQSKA